MAVTAYRVDVAVASSAFPRSPFLFGYAKPVPVNFGALRNPRIGMVLVAAAGPAMNKQALGEGSGASGSNLTLGTAE